MDGGTGTELLFDAVMEPDVDGDGLGDETQDPDGGGLGMDWEDDWFGDWEAGDQLDEDFDEDLGGAGAPSASAGSRSDLRLLEPTARATARHAADQRAEGRPRQRERHAAGQPQDRRGPFTTILTGEMRVKRAGPRAPAPDRHPRGRARARQAASACGPRSSWRTSRASRRSRC